MRYDEANREEEMDFLTLLLISAAPFGLLIAITILEQDHSNKEFFVAMLLTAAGYVGLGIMLPNALF